MGVNIDLRLVRNIFNSILDHIEANQNIESVELTGISDHYYWSISSDDIYNMDKKPDVKEVGNLYDDWNFLMSIINDKENAVTPMIEHLVPILFFISQRAKF